MLTLIAPEDGTPAHIPAQTEPALPEHTHTPVISEPVMESTLPKRMSIVPVQAPENPAEAQPSPQHMVQVLRVHTGPPLEIGAKVGLFSARCLSLFHLSGLLAGLCPLEAGRLLLSRHGFGTAQARLQGQVH